MWHQTRQPTPVRLSRPDVPEGVSAILERMMMEGPGGPVSVAGRAGWALAPFVPSTIAPPSDDEIPKLSLAATGGAPRAGRQSSASAAGGTAADEPGRWTAPPTGTRPATAAVAPFRWSIALPGAAPLQRPEHLPVRPNGSAPAHQTASAPHRAAARHEPVCQPV